jgi:hypothetical protein
VTDVRFFTSSKFTPPALLRRTGMTDEAFVDGVWRPTKSIVDYLFGNDDHVEEISEDEARRFAPAAFATSSVG